MDIELLLKVLALVASAFGAWKILSELARARRSTLRDEYRFAKEFFADIQSKESLHAYVRDKGFEALAGERSLTTREIEYLVSLPCPAQSLREYANGRKYLEHASTAGDKQIMLKKKYQKPRLMWAILLGYFLLFLVAYSAAWSPLLFPSIPSSLGLRLFLALPFTVLAFGPVAYYFFIQGVRVANAIQLVRRVELIRPGYK